MTVMVSARSFTNNSADFDYKVFAALTGHDTEIHSDAHHSGSNALLKEFDIISENELRNIVAKAFSDWHDFKQKYGKTKYNDTLDKEHMLNFLENRRKILQHNNKFEQGLVSYEMGLNAFTDLSHDDVLNTFLGHLSEPSKDHPHGVPFIQPPNATVPPYLDWRAKGYVTPVKDQGGCGSCWTFGAVGALEGLNKKTTQNLAQLSEQELLDCSGEYGTLGCDGGWAMDAYEYVADNRGIAYEKDYPYKAKNQTCMKKSFPLAAPIDGYYMIPNGSEHMLQVAIATQGPVSIAIDVGLDFAYYEKGVYYNENCTTYNLNHEVLAVGYGSDEFGGDYWIIKNSWGVDWGDQGYIRMARNRDNNCGIASYANVPFIREN
ncbi:papain family cysteine protease domain-containing protein [Ditylenchus destructor]|nr:papain family cysteine protease domain-containing protein [Ditylenchus destructor]